MRINSVLKEGETLLLDNNKDKNISKYLLKYLLKYNEQDISKNINITKKEYKIFVKAINKYMNGTSIQYITHEQSFYNKNLYVNKNVLIPRPETEYLVEKSIDYINKYFNKPVIADVCTGSGCIAIAIKSALEESIIFATDISRKALKVASKNIKNSNLDIKLLKGDFLKPIIKKHIKLDVIISNPPYLTKEDKIDKEVLENEPHIALFGGLDGYKKILEQSKEVLNDKAIIAFELQNSIIKKLKQEVKKIYPEACISIEKDLSNKDRYMFIFIDIDKYSQL